MLVFPDRLRSETFSDRPVRFYPKIICYIVVLKVLILKSLNTFNTAIQQII